MVGWRAVPASWVPQKGMFNVNGYTHVYAYTDKHPHTHTQINTHAHARTHIQTKNASSDADAHIDPFKYTRTHTLSQMSLHRTSRGQGKYTGSGILAEHSMQYSSLASSLASLKTQIISLDLT